MDHQRATQRILRKLALRERLPVSNSGLYAMIQKGLFVRPVRLGARAVGWPEAEVEALIAARIAGASDDAIRELVIKLQAARVEFGSRVLAAAEQ